MAAAAIHSCTKGAGENCPAAEARAKGAGENRPAAEARAKGAGENRPAAEARAKGAGENRPAAEARAIGAPPAAVVGARLWRLGSPAPLAGYAPPWDKIGGDLWGRLLDALASPAARDAAAPASLLGYAECAKALLREAPAVYRAVAAIRGLASAAPKSKLPGEPLVYDEPQFTD
jgi:hypothetical protein